MDTPDPPRHAHRAGLYLQALWGRHHALRPEGGLEVPFLDDGGIHLPEDWRARTDAGLLYRAAACHAAAHRRYGGDAWETGELRPRQIALIGALEDARVESLAMARFPGLRSLWARYHPAIDDESPRFPVLARRLARALLLGGGDDNPWVCKGVRLFHAHPDRWSDPELCREIGLRLAHDLGQMRIAMDEGKPFSVARYRDDNRHLWAEYQTLAGDSGDSADPPEDDVPPEARFLREDGKGRVLALDEARAASSGREGWYAREVEPEHAVLEFRRSRTAAAPTEARYPEWHHRLQLSRGDWCTVRERQVEEGDPGWAEAVLRAHRPVLSRLRRLAEGLRLEKVQRARRQQDGDEFDSNALVEAQVELRRGHEPDPRLYYRARPLHDRGLASLVLLDLSESGNDAAPETGRSRLELTREAALMLGHVLEPLGEAFALHGFHSCGRHEVDYPLIKDFDDAFDDHAMARIAGLQASRSTRLGAALRHGSTRLAGRPEQRRLLLVVTDGEPSDIDVHDPEHLPRDVTQAVREARQQDVQVFCLCLDPGAGEAVRRMFGVGHYRVLDHLARLPDLLPQLLLALVRRY